MGQLLGLSEINSSLIANVQYLVTGYMSPQYHLVFDYLFETVFSIGNDALLDDIYNCLDSDCNIYFNDDEFLSDNPLSYHLHHFDEVWLFELDCPADIHSFE